MFTGIVEAMGTVRHLSDGDLQITIGTWRDLKLGESIAVNGCCLTVARLVEDLVEFDLSPETLSRTNLGDLKAADVVNLERAMRAGGRFGGHFVQGHVDSTARIVEIEPLPEGGAVIRYAVPAEYARYVIDKGSVCLDGISLTAVQPEGNEFPVAVIPHTLAATNLGKRRAGDRVNLEVDVLARYVERLLQR